VREFKPASRFSRTFYCFYPHIGRRTNDPAIRRMTMTPYPYLIFYEATDTELIIHAIRHAARDPAGMPGSAC
jgi:plasmid stabilization system protein ParE